MSDDDLVRVLHALRLMGFVDTEPLADRLGHAPEILVTVLERAETQRLVARRAGRWSGWSLTSDGRARGESLLAAELDAIGRRAEIVEGYHRFVAVNQTFLDLCTDWQLRPGADGDRRVNDHLDEDYDAAVVARLGEVDDAVQGLLEHVAAALARFGGYRPRFTGARRLVEAGDRDWFTRPTVDSYHTIWFELHEDLLATLGLERGGEH